MATNTTATVTVEDQGRKFVFPGIPQSWNDLKPAIFIQIAGLYFQSMLPETKTVAVVSLIYSRWLKKVLALSPTVFYDLATTVNFIFDRLDLTKNLIPRIRTRFRFLYGPADKLANVTFGEWIFADHYFVSFSNSGNPADLDKLVSVLYRPRSKQHNPGKPDFNGDLRQPFNENLIEAQLPIVSRIPPATKMAILLFFKSVRSQIIEKYRHVFPTPTGDEKQENSFGWMGVYDELLGEKYATPDILKNAPILNVLLTLERAGIKAKELEKYK